MDKLIITDIDCTILDNSMRKRQSMVEALGKVVASPKGYGVGLEGEERKRFFNVFLSGKYTALDRPYPEAREALKWVVSKGIALVYATGRPKVGMQEPTLKWLEQHDFPVPDQKKVFLFLNEEHDGKLECLRETLSRVCEIGFPLCGIGDRPSDAEGYVSAGFPALILNVHKLSQQDFPRGTLLFDNWDGIKEWIERNG